jgi:superfamily II DNA helicase RecQ
LPTGYGKSLIFQLLPDVYDLYFGVENSIVLVISPLNALMQDQVAKLKERGISACMIQGHGVVAGEGKDDLNLKLPLGELANPTFQLVYMHPEVCVDDKKVIGFLNSAVYQERVRCVVVDEAHLVLNWYV